MKTKFVKIDRNKCTLLEIKDLLESGTLYFKIINKFEKMEASTLASLYDVVHGRCGIYKKVEIMTVEKEISSIKQVEQCTENQSLKFFFSDDSVSVINDERQVIRLEPETIHALAETLKKHGK